MRLYCTLSETHLWNFAGISLSTMSTFTCTPSVFFCCLVHFSTFVSGLALKKICHQGEKDGMALLGFFSGYTSCSLWHAKVCRFWALVEESGYPRTECCGLNGRGLESPVPPVVGEMYVSALQLMYVIFSLLVTLCVKCCLIMEGKHTQQEGGETQLLPHGPFSS